ncbi:hypothetical protein F4802DRAFT_259310 [Xylaria palmicola]|nr:hypothetical protein F4802DRAFT_259310 [Xylaria palmicola]
MARATVQQRAPVPCPTEASTPAPGCPVVCEGPNTQPPPGQIALSQHCEAPGSLSDRATGEAPREGQQNVPDAVPSKQKVSWSEALGRVANTCAVLGLLLALTLGVTQWVAQDRSIAIARESELVTLALSCGEEDIKHTAICQQFLDKYPNGPAISRRESTSEGVNYHLDPKQTEAVHVTLECTAVHLTWMNRFLQSQNSRFQSAFNTNNPRLSVTQADEISDAGKVLLQDIASLKTTLDPRQAGKTGSAASNPTTTHIVPLPRTVISTLFPDNFIIISTVLLVSLIVILLGNELGLFLLLGFYVCMVDPTACWVLLQLERSRDWVTNHLFISFSIAYCGMLLAVWFTWPNW